ncbi:MAG: hypothetical protein LBH55_03710 [Mycoplasmataceae bacterium]|jgi:hypothetical protein|nr:hypothetical protein [Mycoplasmataceae bacterium]
MNDHYSTLQDILDDFHNNWSAVEISYHGNCYYFEYLKQNIHDCTSTYYVTNFDVPCCLAIIGKFDGEEYGFSYSYDDKDIKCYNTWEELLENYEIDGVKLKDVFLSDEVKILAYEY